jgi:hypothetical protein
VAVGGQTALLWRLSQSVIDSVGRWAPSLCPADYALRVHGGFAVLKRYRIAGSDAVLVSIGA